MCSVILIIKYNVQHILSHMIKEYEEEELHATNIFLRALASRTRMLSLVF